MTESLGDSAVAALALALLDLDLPAACLPGVAANLALLADHARVVAPDLA